MFLEWYAQYFHYKNEQQHVYLSAAVFEVVEFGLGQLQELVAFVFWVE